tara:strand:- start:1685 stop:2230 length:546 start_codon:yes stop_codon:yes gene_type:complete
MAYEALFIFLILTLAVQIPMAILAGFGDDNLFLSHYYFIGQFILMSLFFYKTLINKVVKKIIFMVLFGVMLALLVQYFKNPELYYTFNLFEISITSIPIIFYCFSFMVQQISNPEKKFIYFISGLFAYTICSTLIFLAGNIPGDTQIILWTVNNSLYILFQLLIFLEWYRNFREKRLINLT